MTKPKKQRKNEQGDRPKEEVFCGEEGGVQEVAGGQETERLIKSAVDVSDR